MAAGEQVGEELRRYLALCGLTEDFPAVPPLDDAPADELAAPSPPPHPKELRLEPEVGDMLPLPAETDAPPPAADAAAAEQQPFRYGVRIREMPADERPRERLDRYGADALSTAELLAILLRTGTAERSAVSLGDELLSRFEGLRGVAAATLEELGAVPGVGPAKAAQIKAAIEFGRRLVAASPEERPRLREPRDVYDRLIGSLREEKREHFVALLLDSRGGLIRQRTVSIGDLSSSIVHPREVYAEAVRHGASSLIVAHNHPSGDPSPSAEDVTITRRLVEAGQLLGIELCDHIILGDGRWTSLKERGLM